MKIIYVSTVISKKMNSYLIDNCQEKPLQSIQKFNYLLCDGLTKNNVVVKTFSAIPMSRKISNKKIWFEKQEIENNIEFNYLPFINMKIIRQLFLLFSIIFFFLREVLFDNNDDKVFICDALNTTISNTCLLLCKLFGIKCIGIFTDLPKDIGGSVINRRVSIFFQSKYNAYILLTKYMNEIVNPNNKPFIILEGICDSSMLTEKFIPFGERKNKFIYAGGLHERYGVKYMIEAFLELKQKNIELHLYGTGDLSDWIKNIDDERIVYHGNVSNDEVMRDEQSAILLVNPRYTTSDYTKYSFPSKNMEYMSTGTPVLTTKLSGIPDEYFNYTYVIEKETKQSIKKDFEKVLSKSKDTLEQFGKKAKQFVIDKKNKVVQGKKLREFIDNDILKKSTVKTVKESKIFRVYLILYLLLSIFLSRNTLYSSLCLTFHISFLILFIAALPMIYMYYRKLKVDNISRIPFAIITIMVLLMLISCIIKNDFALYNFTNIITIIIVFIFSQFIKRQTFNKWFVIIMLYLSLSSLFNLYVVRPILFQNFSDNVIKQSTLYITNNEQVPFLNLITSFVVWLPNYSRNFAIFTEPSFFQFYLLIASIILFFSNFKNITKILGIMIFGFTLLSTNSTSGIIIFFFFILVISIVALTKIKSKKMKILSVLLFIGLFAILLQTNYVYTIVDGIKYKLFVPNESMDARAGSIWLAIDNFFNHPIIGNSIIPYLTTINITNTLPSIYAIYGIGTGLIVTYIFVKFSFNFRVSKCYQAAIFIILFLSTSSHNFLGVNSFWLILFAISFGKDDIYESSMDS